MLVTFQATNEFTLGVGGAEAECLGVLFPEVLDDEELGRAVVLNRPEEGLVKGPYTGLLRFNGKEK